jgi:hypothetical protein
VFLPAPRAATARTSTMAGVAMVHRRRPLHDPYRVPMLSRRSDVRAKVACAHAEPVNSEARENDAFPCHKHGDKLCRCDIWIEFEIEARPAVKLAGDTVETVFNSLNARSAGRAFSWACRKMNGE